MPRKRPTEASWDSDEDLLEDDSILLNSVSLGDQEEELDEDALLGGSDEDEMGLSYSSKHMARTSVSNVTDMVSAFQDDDVLDIGVNDADDIEETDILSSSGHHPSTFHSETEITDTMENFQANSVFGDTMHGEDFHNFPSDTSGFDYSVDETNNSFFGSIVDKNENDKFEEVENEPSDEESDKSEDEGSHRRGRFRTERTALSGSAMPSKTQNQLEKRDIPDKLEISNEDQEKIEQFMQTNQKSRQRKPQHHGTQIRSQNRQPLLSQQPVPCLLRNPFRQQQRPMMRGPPHMNVGQHHSQQQRHFTPLSNDRIRTVGDGSFRVPAADGMTKQKILINPHFRGSSTFISPPSMVQGSHNRPSHQPRSLMNLGVVRHADQQQFHGQMQVQSNYMHHERPMMFDQSPRFITHHPRPASEHQRMAIHPNTNFIQHNNPRMMSQFDHQRAPIYSHQQQQQPPPSMPQAAAQFVPHIRPPLQQQSYGGTQTHQQQMRVIVSQPPIVIQNRPPLLQHLVSTAGQHLGFSNGPIAQQPLPPTDQYGHQQRLTISMHQQQPHPQQRLALPLQEQPHQFLAASPQQSGFYVNQPPNPAHHQQSHHFTTSRQPPSQNSSFQQNNQLINDIQTIGVIVASQPTFQSASGSDEQEIVGRPIETLVHTRQDPPRVGSATQTVAPKKAKVLLSSRTVLPAASDSFNHNVMPPVTEAISQRATKVEIDLRKKLEDRAKRFAEPPPADVSQSKGNKDNVEVRVGVKRLSDQGISSTSASVKQARINASRKVVAKATAVLQQQMLRQQQVNRVVVNKKISNEQTNLHPIEQQCSINNVIKTAALKQQQQQRGMRLQHDAMVGLAGGKQQSGSSAVKQFEASNTILNNKSFAAAANSKETSSVSTTSLASEAAYDANLEAGLEAQKRLREQILRRKEMRRHMQAMELRQEMNIAKDTDGGSTVPDVNQPAMPSRASNPQVVIPSRASTPQVVMPSRASTAQVVMQQPGLNTSKARQNFSVRPSTGLGRPLLNTPTPAQGPAQQTRAPAQQTRAPAPILRPGLRNMRPNTFNQLRSPNQNTRMFGKPLNSVLISGLSLSTTGESIRQLAMRIGPVMEIRMLQNERRATVKFSTLQHAHQFAATFNRLYYKKFE